MSDTIRRTVTLSHLTTQQLKNLLGEYNNHIKYLEQRLGVHTHQRKTDFVVSGELEAVSTPSVFCYSLANLVDANEVITPENLHLLVQTSVSREQDLLMDEMPQKAASHQAEPSDFTPISLRTRKVNYPSRLQPAAICQTHFGVRYLVWGGTCRYG